MVEAEPAADGDKIYDAFLSHATDPDSSLARLVKSAVEAFHSRPGVQRRYRDLTGHSFEPLRLCVDGKDFIFPRTDPDEAAPIDALVRAYLVRSRSLLVLSGTETTGHPWINREIEWYRELCPDREIHFALTHGADPAQYSAFVPPALKNVGLGLFSDLRGFYHGSRRRLIDVFRPIRSARLRRVLRSVGSWINVRSFDEELARLAARLLSTRGHGDFSVEDLERGFETELRRARKLRNVIVAAVSIVVIGLLGGLADTLWRYAEEQRLRTNRVWTSEADLLLSELNAGLMDSLALSANALGNGDTETAPRVMVHTLQRLAESELLYQRKGDAGEHEAGKRRAHIETLTELGNGREVLLGGIDGYLVLLDTTTGVELAEVFLAHTRVLDIAVLPGQEEIAIGTRSGLFFVRLRRDNHAPVLEIVSRSESDEDVFGVAYDPTMDRIVGGRLDGHVVAFDRPVEGEPWAGRTLYTLLDHELSDPGEEPFISASISDFALRQLPDGTSRAFLASFSHFVVAIDLGQDSATDVWPAFFDEDTAITSLAVDEGGRLVLATDLDGRIFLIDGETGELMREIRSYRTDPASLAVDGSGNWGFSRPDVLGNVGIDLHPSGLFFGVSSHDRTTRFFETYDIGGGIAAVVHDRMVRDVRFSSDGLTGYSISDDGALRRFRLFETDGLFGTYEALRVRGIRNGHPISPDVDTLILTPDVGGPLLWSSDLGLRPVSGLPEAPRNWTSLLRAVGNLVFFGEDTRLFTVTPQGTEALCQGRTVEDLVSLTEREDIRTVYSLGTSGPLLFAPINVDRGTVRLFLFEPRSCSGTPLPGMGYPESAKIATGDGVAAILPEPGRVILWRSTDGAVETVDVVTRNAEIVDVALGAGGENVLIVFGGQAAQRALCLCRTGAFASLSRTVWTDGGQCGALVPDMICTEADLPATWQDGRIGSVHSSPSGRYFIVRGDDARLGLLKVPRWPWHQLALRAVAPRQTRPIDAPFAFTATEDALAVPNGDTGIRIVDPSDLSVLSVLPTPSRVYGLSFDGSRLISTDGANEDAILRERPFCERDTGPRHSPFDRTAPTPLATAASTHPAPLLSFTSERAPRCSFRRPVIRSACRTLFQPGILVVIVQASIPTCGYPSGHRN